jgi:hypothetical protein
MRAAKDGQHAKGLTMPGERRQRDGIDVFMTKLASRQAAFMAA